MDYIIMKYHYRIYRTLMENIRLKNEALEKYPSYVTEVTVFDERETGAQGVEFWISSSDNMDVEINGKMFFLSPSQPVLIKANALGQIFIVGETNSLSFPEIIIRQTEEEECIHIHPSGPIYKKLSSLEKKCCLNAKKRNGDYLIPSFYNNETTHNSLCKSIKHLFHFPSSSEMIYPAFHLVKESGTLVYKEWSDKDLSLYKEELKVKESVQYGRVTDFREAINKKVVKIEEVVFEKNFGLYFLYGVKEKQYVYVVNEFTESSILDIVEILFSLVDVYFNDLFEWLGFFVNSKELFETTQKIATEIRKQHSLFEDSIETSLIENSPQGVNYLWETNKIFTQMINNLDPNFSISETLNASGYIKTEDMGHYEFLSRNFLWQALLNSEVKMDFDIESSILKKDYIEKWDDFILELRKTVQEIQNTADFQSSMEYFSNLFQNPEHFFSYVMSGLLKVMQTLSFISLEVINVGSPKILKDIKKLIVLIESILENEVPIPLLTAYYSEISGGKKLTWFDLPAFTAAIPLCSLKENSKESKEQAFRIISGHQYLALSVKSNIFPLLEMTYKSGFLFPLSSSIETISDSEKKYRTSIAFDLIINGLGGLLPMDSDLKYQSQITAICVSLATSLYQIKDITNNEASEYLFYIIPQLAGAFKIGYLKELESSSKSESKKFSILADAAGATGLSACIKSNGFS